MLSKVPAMAQNNGCSLLLKAGSGVLAIQVPLNIHYRFGFLSQQANRDKNHDRIGKRSRHSAGLLPVDLSNDFSYSNYGKARTSPQNNCP
jgi:hypothetical protein